jgi:hypothetical protein
MHLNFFTTAFIILLYNIFPYFKLIKVILCLLHFASQIQKYSKHSIVLQFEISSLNACFLQLKAIHEGNRKEFYGTKR